MGAVSILDILGILVCSKVLEHRCALFSPAAVDQQPLELTLETIFVPPGEDGEIKAKIEHVRVSRHRVSTLKPAQLIRCVSVRCDAKCRTSFGTTAGAGVFLLGFVFLCTSQWGSRASSYSSAALYLSSFQVHGMHPGSGRHETHGMTSVSSPLGPLVFLARLGRCCSYTIL